MSSSIQLQLCLFIVANPGGIILFSDSFQVQFKKNKKGLKGGLKFDSRNFSESWDINTKVWSVNNFTCIDIWL